MSQVVDVRKEEGKLGVHTNKKKRKPVVLTAYDKPQEKDWVHVIEIHTTTRVYRLFSDDLVVKE